MYLDLEEAWRAVRIADVADPSTLSKAIVIVNLKGVSLRHLWYLSLIKGFAKIGVDYFPEITRNVYMINAPGSFQTIWNAISVFLPQRTKDKVRVLGDDFLEVIASECEGGVDDIPEFLGGKHPGHNICPAKTVKEALEEVEGTTEI